MPAKGKRKQRGLRVQPESFLWRHSATGCEGEDITIPSLGNTVKGFFIFCNPTISRSTKVIKTTTKAPVAETALMI